MRTVVGKIQQQENGWEEKPHWSFPYPIVFVFFSRLLLLQREGRTVHTKTNVTFSIVFRPGKKNRNRTSIVYTSSQIVPRALPFFLISGWIWCDSFSLVVVGYLRDLNSANTPATHTPALQVECSTFPLLQFVSVLELGCWLAATFSLAGPAPHLCSWRGTAL